MEVVDINVSLFVNLGGFIEENCIVELCLVERGGALMHKYFQMVVNGNISYRPVLNQKN